MPDKMENEVDVIELLKELKRRKWFLITLSMIGFVFAAIFSHLIPNIYRSETLLAPVIRDNGGLSNLTSSFGGLASLAGVNLNSGQSDQTTLGLEILKTRSFFNDFIRREEALAPLMASKGWDEATGALVIDSSVFNTEKGIWLEGKKPTLTEAHSKFLESLSIKRDNESGLITITFEHYSPILTQQWLTELVAQLNQTMKFYDVDKAEKSIEYLRKQVSSTEVIELQAGFYSLIQSQIETIMLANSRSEYLYRTLDPPTKPESKVGPKRMLLSLVGLFVGAFLGVLGVLVRYLFKL